MGLLLVVPGMSMPPAQGVEFVVDSAVDEIDTTPGDGICAAESGCTLRAAVMEANAVPGQDTIRIPGAMGISLTLNGPGEDGSLTGDLDILDDLAIVGDGMANSGAEASGLGDRAVHVLSGVSLTLSGVSFFYGNAGGGAYGGSLFNEGTVSADETSFQFSHAGSGGGVMNVGQMTPVRSSSVTTPPQTRGGHPNDGTLTIDQSTISEQRGDGRFGRGIDNRGTLTVRNSTISQNCRARCGRSSTTAMAPRLSSTT
jgi:CSLREA domain-containing protein